MENQLSEESATELIERFVKFYRIYPEDLPKNISAGIKACLSAMRRALMEGRLEIDIEGKNITVTQHIDDIKPGVPEKIIYGKLKGRAKIGMDDDDPGYQRIYALLGALSGDGLEVIQKLEGIDMSLAESLGTVFLQV